MKLIFISGPSGSGKTTLSNQIIKKNKNGIVLSTDNYYKTGLISKLLPKFVEGFFDRSISFNKNYSKKILILFIRMEFQSMIVITISKGKQFKISLTKQIILVF